MLKGFCKIFLTSSSSTTLCFCDGWPRQRQKDGTYVCMPEYESSFFKHNTGHRRYYRVSVLNLHTNSGIALSWWLFEQTPIFTIFAFDVAHERYILNFCPLVIFSCCIIFYSWTTSRRLAGFLTVASTRKWTQLRLFPDQTLWSDNISSIFLIARYSRKTKEIPFRSRTAISKPTHHTTSILFFTALTREGRWSYRLFFY